MTRKSLRRPCGSRRTPDPEALQGGAFLPQTQSVGLSAANQPLDGSRALLFDQDTMRIATGFFSKQF